MDIDKASLLPLALSTTAVLLGKSEILCRVLVALPALHVCLELGGHVFIVKIKKHLESIKRDVKQLSQSFQ